jgi:hypothetical protein
MSNELVAARETGIVGNETLEEALLATTKLFVAVGQAETKINMARITLGRRLLDLRRRIESGKDGDEAALTWWQWYSAHFPPSRSTAEQLMAVAAERSPVAALEAHNKRNAGYQRTFRERQQAKALPSPSPPPSEPYYIGGCNTEPEPDPVESSRPQPKPKPKYVDADGDDVIIDQMDELFEQLSWDGRDKVLKRFSARYREWHAGVR